MAAAPLSLRRKFFFGVTAAAVIFVALLAVTEGILRLAGCGHSTGFFDETRDASGQRWWRENRWVTAPYFPPALIRRPQSIRLPQPKPANTYRVFVLGSSAAMGDPEPAFSLSRTLDLLLRDAFPSVRFEVVNAGVTAINSHVVRALARDCAGLQPDLFIVYEGNNEVIGPFGPGTVFSSFQRSAAAIGFHRVVSATRTGQLVTDLARRLGPNRAPPADWGGMRMFLKNEIERDDPRLAATRKLFHDNLLAIAQSGRAAGASVFLCTVLTNQKDFAPFLSRHRPGLSPGDLAAWQGFFDAGRLAADAGDDTAAEEKFRQALVIDDRHAELSFQLGRLCLRRNRSGEAKGFFQQALDLDTLRFRTDSRLNDTIRELAREVPGGVEVVDLAAAAERQSPQGIIGDELLYEHVHLNFQGTYLMARELFARVAADLARRKIIPSGGAMPEPVSFAEVRRRLAYTTYEQAMIIKELRARFAGAPFSAQSDNVARLRLYAQRDEAATRLLARPESKEALLTLYEQALALNPGDWLLERNIGMACVGLGLPARARPHLERAVAIIPDDADSLFALARALSDLGDKPGAGKRFAELRRLEPRHPGLPPQ